MNEYDRWVAELKAAGWVRHHRTLWRSPEGLFYLGPYKAWQVMRESAGRVTINEEESPDA